MEKEKQTQLSGLAALRAMALMVKESGSTALLPGTARHLGRATDLLECVAQPGSRVSTLCPSLIARGHVSGRVSGGLRIEGHYTSLIKCAGVYGPKFDAIL